MFFNKKQVIESFVTIFYIGKLKYCPGTFGSFIAFPLCYIIVQLIITNQITFSFTKFTSNEAQLISLFIIAFVICSLLFIFGAYFSSIYSKSIMQQDPKEIVIDELVGQMLVIILCSFSIVFVHNSKITEYLSPRAIDLVFLFILPFCLFRFFDILKPWPINWIDQNVKGGIGIMLDDIVAAFLASVIHYMIIFILID